VTFKPETILYVPDVHAQRDDGLARFYDLKRWLADRRIRLTRVIQGGDLWDMAPFCLHDNATPEWYDRHFWDEFTTGLLAFDMLEDIAKRHKATFHVTEGNHENRYNRWMESDNRLRTSPFPKTVADLIAFYRPKSSVNYVPFLQPLVINNIAFSHYFVSGLMGRPQSGERPAGTILKAQHMSCVGCHSHTLDYAERTRADGSKIHALIGGCFVDPAGDFGFAGAARKLWWSGVHLLHVTAPGEFDVESISLSRLSA
jgi:hypothetical protein